MNKYISVAIDKYSMPIIILFPSNIKHIIMSKAMERVGYPIVLSAGFVDDFLQCFGESITLKIKSKSGDTEILHMQLDIDDKKMKFK